MPTTSRHRPRLLIVVTHPKTALYLMRGQLAFLARRGFEVAVASAAGPELLDVARAEGLRTFSVPFRRELSPMTDLAAVLALVRVMRAFRPEIVSASTPKAGLLGMLAARIAGVPKRLLTIRGLRLETVSTLQRWILIRARRLAGRCAHQILCVSPSLRRRYLELGLAPADKTRVLGKGSSNGIDLARFDAADLDERAAALRAGLGIPESAEVVGFVGRLTRDKGIEDLAETFLDSLLPRRPGAFLVLVGDFEVGDAIASETRDRLQRHPRVVCVGWTPDPIPYYRLFTVLAFPSYREGFPNVPLEAAAARLPVVGYAATGTVDAVVEGVTGTLVPVGARTALAERLTAYLDDPESRRLHGEAGRRRVEEVFRQERVWESWLEEYETLSRR